jgi:BolA family transcriptional regulator, general stress-responsive regulator
MQEYNSVAQDISDRIVAALAPTALEVVDDSENHHGHSGHRNGIATHFTLRITATAFVGQSRVARQRMIYDLLSDLMDNPIHALSLDLKPTLNL